MGGSPPPNRAPRNAALDGLRASAALSVFVFHAWLYTLKGTIASAAPDSLANDLFSQLRIGLVLFFVLTGFLLFRAWVRAASAGRPAPSTATYAVRRIGRIVPAYWLAIVGSALLLYPLAGSPGVRLPPAELLPLFFIFAQNFSAQTLLKLDPPMWTLAVEATFYLVLPLLGWLALRTARGRRRMMIVPLLLLAAGVTFNYSITGNGGISLTWAKILPAMLPYFALGMLAAVIIDGREIRPTQARCWLAVGTLLVLADVVIQIEGFGSLHALRNLASAVGFAVIVAVAAARPPKPLELRPLVWVGGISYGLYLWHVPVLLVLRANGLLPLSPWGATLVALPISLLLGWLSLRLVEKPAIAWSRRTKLFRANVSGSA